jgi:thiol-disulfide isomerase/thioredoxin
MNRRRGALGLRIGVWVGGLALVVLSVSCGRRFPDPSQQGEFERIVLLEEGTATWCTYCPAAAENIEELLGAHPGEFIVLALHRKDEYSSDESEARLSDLGVVAYPTIIFDGVEKSGRGVDEMAVILEDRRALGSPIKLELTASLTGDSVSYEITAVVSEKIAEDIEGTLRIALLEDTVTDASVGLLGHVVRRLPEAETDDALVL